jgi:hypothetical protein
VRRRRGAARRRGGADGRGGARRPGGARDGGASWSSPALLDAGGHGFNDKPSITADPTRPGTAYAVWTLEGAAFMSRTRDAGASWSP